MNEFETARLKLRHIKETDAEDCFDYFKEPNIGRAAGWAPHSCIEETKIIMKELFIDKPNIYGIVLKENNKLIGSIGLLNDTLRNYENAMMLGYGIIEKHWGKGLVPEAGKALICKAFNELPVSVISCTCYSNNFRSKRVIEKCGFKYEGRLRQGEIRYDGEIMDLDYFSILRSEFNLFK